MENVGVGKNTVLVTKGHQWCSKTKSKIPFVRIGNAVGMPARRHAQVKARSKERRINTKDLKLTKNDETSYFAPKTWMFWRGIIMYFFIFSVVGHWLEIPYCLSMDALFGIVADDYAMWVDPLYVPYWVYGVGATIITLLMLPLKTHLIGKRKTLWGAAIEFFVLAVVLCAAMETIIGLIINQPNEFGKYPWWDNSVLPLNILEQGWLVNDVVLGVVSLVYVWAIFPFCQKVCKLMGERAANRVFVCVLVLFAFICFASYALPAMGF